MSDERRNQVLALVAALGVLVLPISAQAPQKWLHLKVADVGGGADNVAANIPLSMVSALLASMPSARLSADGELTVEKRHGVSISGLREMWQEVRNAGNLEFFTAQHGDETIRVRRSGRQLKLWLESEREVVQVEMPVVVVAALLLGDGETLNLSAALNELSTLEGDIVRASRMGDSEQRVRIWIDEQNSQ